MLGTYTNIINFVLVILYCCYVALWAIWLGSNTHSLKDLKPVGGERLIHILSIILNPHSLLFLSSVTDNQWWSTLCPWATFQTNSIWEKYEPYLNVKVKHQNDNIHLNNFATVSKTFQLDFPHDQKTVKLLFYLIKHDIYPSICNSDYFVTVRYCNKSWSVWLLGGRWPGFNWNMEIQLPCLVYLVIRPMQTVALCNTVSSTGNQINTWKK